MAIHIPESKASIRQNQVEVFLPGEKKPYYVPKMQYLLADQRSRMSELSSAARAFIEDHQAGRKRPPSESEAAAMAAIERLQREIFESHIPDLYKKLTSDQIQFLQEEWNRESGVSLGESSASAGS